MLHNYYITPEEYEIAEKNGISQRTVYQRVYTSGWDKQKAITEPIRTKKHERWKKVAEQNGIAYQTYISRVNDLDWSKEKAATTPTQKRKHSLKIINKAKSNGISYQMYIVRLRRGWSVEDASTIKPLTKAESGRMGALKRLENMRGRYENTL